MDGMCLLLEFLNSCLELIEFASCLVELLLFPLDFGFQLLSFLNELVIEMIFGYKQRILISKLSLELLDLLS